MKISFQLPYHTHWGEDVRILFSDGMEFPLHTRNGEIWRGSLELDPITCPTEINYQYAIYQDGICTRKEWNGVKRRLNLNQAYTHLILNDAWRDRPEDSYFYSSAFSGEEAPYYPSGTEISHSKSILLKVRCPRFRHKKWQLAISGNQRILGEWDVKTPKMMQPCGPNEWCILLDATGIRYPFEYKYLAWDTENNCEGEWISGNNRQISSLPLQEGDLLVISDDEVHFDLPAWKAAGVAVPVFSLRSEQSFGVGDFGDLKKMIDWAVLTGQKIVQILPINDTTITHTWTDSYPYNSISIYAFHPMYIDLNQLETLEDAEQRASFEQHRQELNALPQVDYEAVNQYKLEYLHLLFQQMGKTLLESTEFRLFFKENKHWLVPYSVFCYLRDKYGTPVFRNWPEHQVYHEETISRMAEEDTECRPVARFNYFLQYILHVQLRTASEYARNKGVLLKGDIPIGISPNSVEAWTEPYYFNLNGQAGAPPDPFSETGQNWGFPTYNWDTMQQDGYKWWKKRFHKMAEYFDAYRIDHILGFFRIWEIPSHSVQGLLGQFVPALPMSAEEINRFGLFFRKEAFTKPYITESILEAKFGELKEQVKQEYLFQITPHEYALRPEYNTQRQVEQHFLGKNDPQSNLLRNGLFELINNVLFVVDRKDPNLYHPRIAVQNEPVYESLTPSEKTAFDQLYTHYFYHRHNDFWYHEAMKKLPELTDSTRMLVCGEDLGMIPDCVKGVMDELRILSLEIQRMPKNPAETFGDPAHYPYRSVCTISTHDMSTLRGWCHEDANLTRRYFYDVLGGWGDYPTEAPGWLCDSIVLKHLLGNSMLCILSLQDWLSINEEVRYPDADAERINVPANPRHYWRYRMHITIEDLMQCTTLNDRIRDMIGKSGRINN